MYFLVDVRNPNIFIRYTHTHTHTNLLYVRLITTEVELRSLSKVS